VTDAISNTSPLVYLYRIHAFDWLPRLFPSVWVSTAVARELDARYVGLPRYLAALGPPLLSLPLTLSPSKGEPVEGHGLSEVEG
jgi:hypothetical protein